MDRADALTARANRLRWPTRLALAAAPAAAVLVFTVWPFATLLGRVVRPSTWSALWRVGDLGGTWWYTLWQAAASTLLTLLVGMVPAYVLHRFRFRGRAVARALMIVPFFLPTVVVAAAFVAVLPGHWRDTPRAVVAAHVYLNVAVVVQIVGAMWEVVPHDLTGAARTLGASPWQVARHVVLPVLRPALASAAAVVFVFCFTSFGAAKLLGGVGHPTVEMEIVRLATQIGDIGSAAVLAVLQLLVVAAVLAASTWVQRRTRLALAGDARPVRVTVGRWPARVGLAGAALFAAPVVAMAIRSLRGASGWTVRGWTHLGDTGRRGGLGVGVDLAAMLRTSFGYAAMAAVLATVLGVLGAVVIDRAAGWGWLLDAGLALPLATSAVTIGLGMLITFDHPPVDWRASWWLVPVGHALIATPFAVRTLLGVLRAVPADRRAAAATLGASPWRVLREVDGRALRRPAVSAAGLAAAISLGEFGATTVLSRSGHETMPLAIGRLLGRAGTLPLQHAYVLATILALACAVVVGLTDVFRPSRWS